MTERVLCGLPRSASGDEDIEIGAIWFVRPQHMVFGMMDVLVLPHVASAIEDVYRGRVRMIGVELVDWIGVLYLHCDRLSCNGIGAKIIHAPKHIATNQRKETNQK